MIIGLMSVGQMEPLGHLGSLTEQLRGPARLAIAPDDSVFVTDPLNRHIARFDATGSLLDTWPVPEVPIGVAVHPDGRIFVSLRDGPNVAIYDSEFSLLGHLGEDDPQVSFVGPTDIDIATDTGRIYVVDSPADRIYAFESDGSLALTLGSRGNWPGQFVYPSAITVDEPRDRIIIADHDMYRLVVFTTSGVFLMQFGDRMKPAEGGGEEGWMPRTQGVTVDAGGRIFVTDALMGTVRVFDPTGVELGKVVEYGYDPGELRVPCDLAVAYDGSRLYVASTNTSSVEVYDTTDRGGGGGGGAGGRSTTGDLWLAEENPGEPGRGGGPRETSLDGPHWVEERTDICKVCHTITGQPGAQGGSLEGQPVLCMSCHNVGGRALNRFLNERDLADPYETNPAAADGRGRSHAWGVAAVNPLADSDGPTPGGPMDQHLDCEQHPCNGDGNIKCSTCHDQHNSETASPYLRVSNDGDAMCKECHAPRDTGPGEGGSHPVGFVYPAGEGEYPAGGELGPLFIKDGMVECMTCHGVHGADSGGVNGGDGDGMLLRQVNDETLCRACHTQHTIHDAQGEWRPPCVECHYTHDVGNENIALISREIDGAPVTFVEGEGSCNGRGDYVHSVCDPPTYDGLCEVCHTTTAYHRNSAEEDHTHYADVRCTACHPHGSGFLPSAADCTLCHAEPPDGTEFPNKAAAHEVHMTGVNGPGIADCGTCHASEDSETHMNAVVSFVSGSDDNGDGDIDLTETDVCDTCHGVGGPLNGVNDPEIGAKVNWLDGVYDGDVLKPEKFYWCAGCHDHDTEGAEVNGVTAPPVAGDNETWGDIVDGHGVNHVACTDCHDPTLSHTDGVEVTFSERFPLCPVDCPPGWDCKCPEERELDREAYNNGYRLRRIDGERALEVPRECAAYTADDFRLCFECHDEIKLLGVPSNYDPFPPPPDYLQLPEGVAQTNYRNDLEWGWGWTTSWAPVNAHWRHTGLEYAGWNIDQDHVDFDSCFSCVTCHNPHGTRDANGDPTIAMTSRDLDITYGVYNDGETDWEYGYIGSDAYAYYEDEGGDLHCHTCHPQAFGEENDPPLSSVSRYYREWLDLWPKECLECHE